MSEPYEHDGVLWLRHGECNGCGECCQGDPFLGDRGTVIEGACPLLRSVAGTFRCSGHGVDDYYLAGCAVFPQFPEQIADKPNCSYTFERVN